MVQSTLHTAIRVLQKQMLSWLTVSLPSSIQLTISIALILMSLLLLQLQSILHLPSMSHTLYQKMEHSSLHILLLWQQAILLKLLPSLTIRLQFISITSLLPISRLSSQQKKLQQLWRKLQLSKFQHSQLSSQLMASQLQLKLMLTRLTSQFQQEQQRVMLMQS